MAFSGSGSRTKVALLLSLVRASVAELVLRTLAQDEQYEPTATLLLREQRNTPRRVSSTHGWYGN